ncbi:kinase-like domain-containing protein [Infundibulicybe gibba]|nr:kinase-like domain-containing protein [Infundibulicybe gibba]
MHFADICLGLTPVPFLTPAFGLFKFIEDSTHNVHWMQEHLKSLIEIIAELLQTLDKENRDGHLSEEQISLQLGNLVNLLNEFASFVGKLATQGLLKFLYTQKDHLLAIGEFHRRITIIANALNLAALLDIEDWQAQITSARARDQVALNGRLNNLETNQNQLAEELSSQHGSAMAIMVSLQKALLQQGNSRERQFLSHALNYLSSTSGQRVHLESWTISALEVDFGAEIGCGGFGKVYKGTWNKTPVALKVLRGDAGAVPSSSTIRREIETWANLRHPHVLQFLGANILDDQPFIVMPYMRNGNARDYVQEHPTANRVKILYHTSLGLVHLHSQNVVHGDLKALNVLIDDAGNALLCDFGLSRVKADATSRSMARPATSSISGSRNWMAPERILGGTLKKPVDIYAFGMTIFEIFVAEVPLGHLAYTDFVDLVVGKNVRPEKPDEEDAPDLSDELWALAEACWVKAARERPDAVTVCDEMTRCWSINQGSARATIEASSPTRSVPPASYSTSPAQTAPPAYYSERSMPLPQNPFWSSSTANSATSSLSASQSRNISPPPWSANSPPRMSPRQGHSGTSSVQSQQNVHQEVSQMQQPAQQPPSTHQRLQSVQHRAGSPTLHQPPLLVTRDLRARVTHSYKPMGNDPHEISIKKGELLDVVNNEGHWWIARKANGAEGIVPSNYLQIIPAPGPAPQRGPAPNGNVEPVRRSITLVAAPVPLANDACERAKARHSCASCPLVCIYDI